MATRKEISEAAISEAAAVLGRKGGKKKVPKGLAVMDPKKAHQIRSAGGKNRWKNHHVARSGKERRADEEPAGSQ